MSQIYNQILTLMGNAMMDTYDIYRLPDAEAKQMYTQYLNLRQFPFKQALNKYKHFPYYFQIRQYWINLNVFTIHQISTAFDNTLVMLVDNNSQSQSLQILHFLPTGNLINCTDVNMLYRREFGMLRNDKIILWEKQGNQMRIVRFCLKIHKKEVCSDSLIINQVTQFYGRLHFFPQSDLVCLVQQRTGKYNNKTIIKLTYYRYNDMREKKSVAEFKNSIKQTTFYKKSQPLNKSSKISWILKCQAPVAYKCFIFELNHHMKGVLRIIEISLTEIYKNIIKPTILNLKWEIQANVYEAILPYNYKHNKKCPQNYSCHYGIIRLDEQKNEFSFVSNNNQQYYVPEMSHTYWRDKELIHLHDVTISLRQLNLKHYQQICIRLQSNSQNTCNNYYIYNKTSYDACFCFQSVGWDDGIFLQLTSVPFHQILGENLRVRVIRPCLTVKDLYMHLLQYLNQDFDDDLLEQAMEMLIY